ncbi:MAG: hypothetical protein BGO41_01330 [Clostridiales bacterium 38-18]|nr:MAG: hypothetical protein BGO41_01330 [Clostridiales bacterium 38-18]
MKFFIIAALIVFILSNCTFLMYQVIVRDASYDITLKIKGLEISLLRSHTDDFQISQVRYEQTKRA